MEAVLSDFIARTGAEPTLAREILQGDNWNIQKALDTYYYFTNGISSKIMTPRLNQSNIETDSCVKKCVNNFQSHAQPTINDKNSSFTPHLKSTTACKNPEPSVNKPSSVVDSNTNRKLTRGLSKATENVGLVSKARDEVEHDFDDKVDGRKTTFFVETPIYTFTLPDLSVHSDDFRSFLEKDLIEMSTLVSLENAGRLNWWAEVSPSKKLWPLATSGDGNCLLHAASLGMWGFHDRLLTLRKALHATLTHGPFRDAFWRRWRWQQTLQNKQAEFVYSESEWEKEWDSIIKLSSTQPRSCKSRKMSCCDSVATKGFLDVVKEESGGEGENRVYESLEELHVLALAHVLRRTVIVVADKILKAVTGEPLAPIPFGGIYLPLEISPSQCHRSPLVLTYDAAHFSALVSMDNTSDDASRLSVIPLVDPDLQLLTIQFAVDPGVEFRWGIDEFNNSLTKKLVLTDCDKIGLLNEYLDVVKIALATRPKHGSTSSSGSNEGRHSLDSDDGQLVEVKSRTSKQLQSVAKQFGSLGRNVGKKFKKNFGNFTRNVSRTGSFRSKNSVGAAAGQQSTDVHESGTSSHYRVNELTMISAMLHTNKRHEYQEEMIRNYLSSARERYSGDKHKVVKSNERQQRRLSSGLGMQDGPVHCINPGCDLFGTVATSYMCSSCFEKQKRRESEMVERRTNSPTYVNTDSIRQSNTSPTKISSSSPNLNKSVFGHDRNSSPDIVTSTGRSKFYASLRSNYDKDRQLSKSNPRNPVDDPTVYLSNSVFFNDQKCPNSNDSESRLCPPFPVVPSDEVSSVVVVKPGDDNVSRVYVNSDPRISNRPCRTTDCPFYGNGSTGYYCSKCYKQTDDINALGNVMNSTRI